MHNINIYLCIKYVCIYIHTCIYIVFPWGLIQIKNPKKLKAAAIRCSLGKVVTGGHVFFSSNDPEATVWAWPSVLRSSVEESAASDRRVDSRVYTVVSHGGC